MLNNAHESYPLESSRNDIFADKFNHLSAFRSSDDSDLSCTATDPKLTLPFIIFRLSLLNLRSITLFYSLVTWWKNSRFLLYWRCMNIGKDRSLPLECQLVILCFCSVCELLNLLYVEFDFSGFRFLAYSRPSIVSIMQLQPDAYLSKSSLVTYMLCIHLSFNIGPLSWLPKRLNFISICQTNMLCHISFEVWDQWQPLK